MPWRGVLLDVGGVLQAGGALLPGAAEAVAALRARGVPFRLLSNTTSRSRASLAAELREAWLAVEPGDLLTATGAAAAHLPAAGGASLFIVSPGARQDLAGLPEDAERPAHVVLGDTDEAFSRPAMDRAFRALRAGADLVAMARNRWYAGAAGPVIDIGAVVAALEYAADVRATVTGKPSRAFFRAGAAALGLPPAEVAMVGDDPEADVAGARAAGLGAVWVGDRAAWPPALPGPHAVIGSAAGIPGLVAGA